MKNLKHHKNKYFHFLILAIGTFLLIACTTGHSEQTENNVNIQTEKNMSDEKNKVTKNLKDLKKKLDDHISRV